MEAKKEHLQRISRLQNKIQQQGLDGALIIYAIDVYYFTGTRQNAILWVPSQGESVLMVRKSFIRAKQESPLDDIRPFNSSKQLPGLLEGAGTNIGLTLDVLPVTQYNFYSKLLPGKDFSDISLAIREIRSVKSKWEIEQMKASAQRLTQVFSEIPHFLKPGMREIDLAAEMECRGRKLGLEGYTRMRAFNQEIYWGHILSGVNAGYPSFFDGPAGGKGLSKAYPHGASTTVIEANVPILVDYTGVFNGYIVDMTRIFAFGSISDKLKTAFATAVDIQNYMVEKLKPGTMSSDLFNGAREMAEKAGLGDNFMGVPGEQVKFVGHGIGVELDELPVIAQGLNVPLQVGHTVALEPKFVLPEEGMVGIENTFVIGEKGAMRITELDDGIIYI